MALPSSGPLSFQDIATELGVNPPLSLASMSTTAGFAAPYAVTNFYGYSGGGGGGVITDGLVLYVDASNPASYSGTGTTWFDLSPNGNNGTLSGNATYNSGNGGFISLQSNTGFINFGSGSAGSNTSSYTWGAWVKFTDVSSTNIFMARGNDSSGGWNLAAVMLTTGFNASMVTTVPSTSQINSVYSTTPVANTWYYYTAVFDAGVSLKVYINGVLSATQNSSSTNLRNSGEGWSSSLGTTYYNADYGSMIAYNTALTDAEVLQNYNATKERFDLVTTGLILNLDAGNPSSYSGSGTTWTDLTGNGYNAELVGSPTFVSNGNKSYFNLTGSNYMQGNNSLSGNGANQISGNVGLTVTMVVTINDASARSILFGHYQPSGIAGYVYEAGSLGGLWTNSIRVYMAGSAGQGVDARGSANTIATNGSYVLSWVFDYPSRTTTLYVNTTAIGYTQAGFPSGLVNDWNNSVLYSIGYAIPTEYSQIRVYGTYVYNIPLDINQITQNYIALLPKIT
jgi:hypothetical protein